MLDFPLPKQHRQLGDADRDARRLVINLSVHLLIAVAISPPDMDGIEQFVRHGGGQARGVLPCMG
jgi:hypothetical protein